MELGQHDMLPKLHGCALLAAGTSAPSASARLAEGRHEMKGLSGGHRWNCECGRNSILSVHRGVIARVEFWPRIRCNKFQTVV